MEAIRFGYLNTNVLREGMLVKDIRKEPFAENPIEITAPPEYFETSNFTYEGIRSLGTTEQFCKITGITESVGKQEKKPIIKSFKVLNFREDLNITEDLELRLDDVPVGTVVLKDGKDLETDESPLYAIELTEKPELLIEDKNTKCRHYRLTGKDAWIDKPKESVTIAVTADKDGFGHGLNVLG